MFGFLVKFPDNFGDPLTYDFLVTLAVRSVSYKQHIAWVKHQYTNIVMIVLTLCLLIKPQQQLARL